MRENNTHPVFRRKVARLRRSALLLVFFATCSVAHSQEPIRKISQILELDKASAAKGLPVDLEATVYYFDDAWRFFFAAQGNDFIYVHNGTASIPMGAKVRLVGRTQDGHLKNTIRFESATVLGAGKTVEPIPITIDKSTLEEHDCRWVTLEGGILTAKSRAGQTELRCKEGKTRFLVTVSSEMSPEEMINLIDARIRVTGNLCANIRNDVVTTAEICCESDHIEIVRPAADPFNFVKRRTIDETWNDESAREFHLAGQVTYVEEHGFFIERESGGTWIKNDRSLPVQLGTFGEFFGTRLAKRGSGFFIRVFDVDGTEPLLQPSLKTTKQLRTLKPESRRVQVEGRLVTVFYGNNNATIVMRAEDDTSFIVYSPISEERLLSMDLASAVDLRVTGTVSFHEEGYDFAIYAPSHDSLMVTQRAASRKKIFTLLGVLCPLLAFLAIWGRSQRTQVRERKKDLEKITAELRMSFDSIRDGILVLDRDQKFVHANRKVGEFMGVDVSPGDPAQRFEDSLLPRLKDQSFIDEWKRFNASDTLTDEFELQLAVNGKWRSLEAFTTLVKNEQSEILARLWAFHDVTEKQNLQASLLHAQKQEAIGQLAGGFAHDFNNLLTGVIGNLSLAGLDESRSVGEVDEYLQAAMGASGRAATLVSQLLGFSKKTRLDLRPNDVNAIIVRMEPLLKPLLKSVKVVYDLKDDIPAVYVDATQLEQVLLNICLNSLDAIGETGEIRVRSYVRDHNSPEGDSHVAISIRDSGCGIPDDIRDNIFDPFFTTKQGKGTGLGLAMAEGIVQQHDGWIECDTTVSKGTEFRVYLPTCREQVSNPVEPPSRSKSDLTGRTILVVDDEELVRVATSKILEHKGAKTYIASDGLQAVSMVEKNTDIDLVLLDWTMPVLSGRATLQRISQVQPELPVVICSGFIFDVHEVVRQAKVTPRDVIQKPFGSEEITTAIQNVLGTKHDLGTATRNLPF